jgi:uncharacterized protein (TIGR00255 family)
MTGYGRAEITKKGITVTSEVRSVNNRYLELTTRIPRSLALREKEIKEIVRSLLNRGSLNVTVKVERDTNSSAPLKVNAAAAKSYYALLNSLRKTVHLRERVKLEHLLNFSEILEPEETEAVDETEWTLVQDALRESLRQLNIMRAQEGGELAKDLAQRIQEMDVTIERIEHLSKVRIPEERARLLERVSQLMQDKGTIDQNRLELEIALLAEKLDVTEECVRYRSHNKFFLEALDGEEAAGRKLNFLVQEMNREANTIGSKASDATIAHLVVQLKEEMEKIREQLQNIE